MKYKVRISFDEINYVWIIIENGKVINRNATKEEILKIPTKAVYYNKTNICPVCLELREIVDKSILYPRNIALGYKTGRRVCPRHINEESSKYKLYISIDGKNFFWAVCHNGILIKDPTKEDLKYAKLKKYNDTNICPICRVENKITDYSILYPKNAYHDIDKNGIMTLNEWVCRRHYNSNYKRYNPNSWNNIEKSLRDRRTGNLHDPSHILGDNCEELTKKLFGVERLSLKYNNFRLSLDHTRIPEKTTIMIGDKLFDLSKKLPETKGSHYHYSDGYWHAHIRNKDFDILILYCISEDGKIVERIYVIPKYEIKNDNDVCIYKNPSKGGRRYREYKVTDQHIIINANESWKRLNEK